MSGACLLRLLCVAALRLESLRLPESLQLPDSLRLPEGLRHVIRLLPRRAAVPHPALPLPPSPPPPNPLLSSLHDALESVAGDSRLSSLHGALESMAGYPPTPTPPPPPSPPPPRRFLPSLAAAAAAAAALGLLVSAWLVPRLLRPAVECSYAFVRLSPGRGLSVGLAAVRLAPASALAAANANGLGLFFPTRLTDAHFDELALDISLAALAALLWRRRRQREAAMPPAAAPAGRLPPVLTVRIRGALLLHAACPAPEWHGGAAELEAYLLSAKEGAAARAVAVLEPHAAAAADAASTRSCAVPPAPLGSARRAIRLALPHVRIVAAPCELRYADAPCDACLTLRWRRLQIDFDEPPAATHAGVAPQRIRVRMGGFRVHTECLPLEATGTLQAAEKALRKPPRLPPLLCVGSHEADAGGGPAGGRQGWLRWVRCVCASALGQPTDAPVTSGLEVSVATEYRPDLVSSRTVRIKLYGPAPLRLGLCPERQGALDRLSNLLAEYGAIYSATADAVHAGRSAQLVTAGELDALIARYAAAATPQPTQPTQPPQPPQPPQAAAAQPLAAPAAGAAADAIAYPTHLLAYAQLLGSRRARREAGGAPPPPAAGLASLCARLRHPSVASGGSGVPVPPDTLAPPVDPAWLAAVEALEAGERLAADSGGIPASILDSRARQLLAVTDHLQHDPPPLDLAPHLSRCGFTDEPARLQLEVQLPYVVMSLSSSAARDVRESPANVTAKVPDPSAATATPPLRELARLTLGPDGGGVDLRLSQRRRGKAVQLTLGNFHVDDPAADGCRSTPFRELLAPCSHPGGGGARKPPGDTPMLRMELSSSTLGEPPPSCLPAALAAAGWPAGPPPVHTAVRLELCNVAFVLLAELLGELGGWRDASAVQAKPRPLPLAEARATHPLALGAAGPLWLSSADVQNHRAGKWVPVPAPPGEAAPPYPPRVTTDRSTWRGLQPWTWEDELAARAARAAMLAPVAPVGVAGDELRDGLLLRGSHLAASVSARNVLLILPCAAEGVAAFNEDADKGWAFCIAVSDHRRARAWPVPLARASLAPTPGHRQPPPPRPRVRWGDFQAGGRCSRTRVMDTTAPLLPVSQTRAGCLGLPLAPQRRVPSGRAPLTRLTGRQLARLRPHASQRPLWRRQHAARGPQFAPRQSCPVAARGLVPLWRVGSPRSGLAHAHLPARCGARRLHRTRLGRRAALRLRPDALLRAA